jgi:hypothetical protein
MRNTLALSSTDNRGRIALAVDESEDDKGAAAVKTKNWLKESGAKPQIASSRFRLAGKGVALRLMHHLNHPVVRELN